MSDYEYIMKIAIIGAGIMGSGIAQNVAMSGISIDLIDTDNQALENAKQFINSSIDNAVEKNIIKVWKKNTILESISYKNSIDELSDDIFLVIESISEDFKLKAKVFKELEQKCPAETIFATNTSCLSVTKLAQETNRKEKFIGMHFFYPAEKNKLLEIITTEHTDMDTIDKITMLGDILDKIPVKVKDSPGFSVNRYFVPILNEATKLLELHPESIYIINYAVKAAFKASIGPFEIMNLTGTTLAYQACLELQNSLGSFYAPAPLLKEYAKTNKQWDLPPITKFKDTEASVSKLCLDLVDHFQGLIITICLQMIQENVSTVNDISLGSKVGLGWKSCPCDIVHNIGLEKAQELVQNFLIDYPIADEEELFSDTANLKTSLIYYLQYKNVARIKLRRPHALNALSFELFTDINEALDQAINDTNIKFITIEGYPKVFSAGADLKFFIKNIKARKFNEIDEYTELAHSVLTKIVNSPKPVIAVIDGLAIGGGLELALSCHFIIATDRSYFHFPETALGLFPAFGGTQRVPKRVGIELARYLILLGNKVNAGKALEFGLIDKYIKNYSEFYSFIDEISRVHNLNVDYLIETCKDSSALTIDTVKNMRLLKNIDLLITRKLISKRAKELADQLESKHLDAIDVAGNLINSALDMEFEEGLKLESQKIKKLFQEPDLLNNLINVVGPNI